MGEEDEKMKDLEVAYKFSSKNKLMLEKDTKCGCFYCLEIFQPSEIVEWIDDSPETAECPYCSIDAVIGESSGYPITKEFLEKMHNKWF